MNAVIASKKKTLLYQITTDYEDRKNSSLKHGILNKKFGQANSLIVASVVYDAEVLLYV